MQSNVQPIVTPWLSCNRPCKNLTAPPQKNIGSIRISSGGSNKSMYELKTTMAVYYAFITQLKLILTSNSFNIKLPIISDKRINI